MSRRKVLFGTLFLVVSFLLVLAVSFALSRFQTSGSVEKSAYSGKDTNFQYAALTPPSLYGEEGLFVIGDYIKGASSLGLPVYYFNSEEERERLTGLQSSFKIVLVRGDKILEVKGESLADIKSVWEEDDTN